MAQQKSPDKPKDDLSSDELEESTLDFSQLTTKEKDDLILEMHTEEMMKKIAELTTIESKAVVKKKKKQKETTIKNIAPGFGWVALKMTSAMTFSLVFTLLGPVILIMAFTGRMGDKMWMNAIFGFIGIGLLVIAWYLFKYLVKD